MRGIPSGCSLGYFELKKKTQQNSCVRLSWVAENVTVWVICLKMNVFICMCVLMLGFTQVHLRDFTLAPLVFAVYTFHRPANWRVPLCANTGKLGLSNERHSLRCPQQVDTLQNATELNPSCSNVLFHPCAHWCYRQWLFWNDSFKMQSHTDILYCPLSHSLSVMRGTTWARRRFLKWAGSEQGGCSDEAIEEQ